MRALVFQLAGPLSAFGDVAVGEHRGVFDRPSKSGVLGLIAAALGVVREDEAAHARLAADLDMASATMRAGRTLHDYHTTQTAAASMLKRLARTRVIATRADELADGLSLETILSRRAYRVEAFHLVALVARAGADTDLDALASALRRPVFVLYLGRKSCPPDRPLFPRVIEAEDVSAAFRAYRAALPAMTNADDIPQPGGLAAEATLVPAGANARREQRRRDHPASRRRRQFTTRTDVWFEEAP